MSPTRKNRNIVFLSPFSNKFIEQQNKKLKQLNKTTYSRPKRENSQTRKYRLPHINLTQEQKEKLKKLTKESMVDNKLNKKVLMAPTLEEEMENIKTNAEKNPYSSRTSRTSRIKKSSKFLSSHR